MNLFDKGIDSFEVIDLESEMKFDDHIFQSFLFLLNRLAKGNSQNVKFFEQIQTNISKQMETSREHINELLSEKHRLIEDNKLFETGIIRFADIIFLLENALETINQEQVYRVFEPMITVNTETLAQLGFHRLPTLGLAVDNSLHSVKGTIPTNDPQLDGTICSVIREGYRRGDKIIRTADVISYQYK